MDNVTAPALLAYKGGDVFATIVEIANQLPNGRDCSTSSLEDLLMQYVSSCSTRHHGYILTASQISRSIISYIPLFSSLSYSLISIPGNIHLLFSYLRVRRF